MRSSRRIRITVLLSDSPLGFIESRSPLWLGNGFRATCRGGTSRATSFPRRRMETSPPSATCCNKELNFPRASRTPIVIVFSVAYTASVHFRVRKDNRCSHHFFIAFLIRSWICSGVSGYLISAGWPLMVAITFPSLQCPATLMTVGPWRTIRLGVAWPPISTSA